MENYPLIVVLLKDSPLFGSSAYQNRTSLLKIVRDAAKRGPEFGALEMELHMINIIYAALPMREQTEKTTFSCKDD